MRRWTPEERRARLVARHGLDRSCADPVAATRAVYALHSSDPCTPHLGLWARVPGYRPAALEAAVGEGALVRMHAVRRTLFLFARDDVAAMLVAASAPVAAKERRRLEGWLAAEGEPDPAALLTDLARQVRGALEGHELATRQLFEAAPDLTRKVTLGSGKWSSRAPVGSRLLLLMAMDGDIVRTTNAGSWRASRYRWGLARSPGGGARRPGDAAARSAVVARYLERYGPATRDDVRWWTGWSAKHVDAALESHPRATVDEGPAWVAAPGQEPDVVRAPGAALLPALDPALMGHKHRDWLHGEHKAALFDRNGNVGPTVLWGGRVVGGWAAREGRVLFELLEDVGADARRAVAAEAELLTAWLDGATPVPRFRTPLEQRLAGAPTAEGTQLG